ncbi:MAG TPA: PEP-CTERM sorting domain-containing protein, partial [Phycisphaerae bacterium]|nr:PEP-CTERM sorting domain-containing protein [Phycisphaerae bacterium]
VSAEPLVQWNGLIKAEFYDSAVGTGPGQALLEVELDRFYSASDPIDQWVEIGGSAIAPAGADVGRVVLMIVDWQPDPGGALNIDNVVVTPEPGALALLGLGAAVLLRRRR